jgi:hypothetical protein
MGLLAGVSTLSACDGDSLNADEEGSKQKEYWLSLSLPPKELVGSWAQARIITGENEDDVFAVDEVVLVITESGEQYSFDYLGDNYASISGSYENCYRPYNVGNLRQVEGDRYLLAIGIEEAATFWSDIDYELDAETLNITEQEYIPAYKSTAVRSELTLGELQVMVCSD